MSLDPLESSRLLLAIGLTVFAFGLFCVFVSALKSRYSDGDDILFSLLLMVIFTAMAVDTYSFTQEEFEKEYLKEKVEYEMGNCDWKLFFADSAEAETYKFLKGGDRERGELALYFQQECKDDPDGVYSFNNPRGRHHLPEPYRTIGDGGWNGTVPLKEDY